MSIQYCHSWGVEDIKTIAAQRLDIQGEDVQKIMSEALKEAEEVANRSEL